MKLLLQILITLVPLRLLLVWINKNFTKSLLEEINGHKVAIDNVCATNGYSTDQKAYEQLSERIETAKFSLSHLKIGDLSRASRLGLKAGGPPLKSVVFTLCKDDPVTSRIIMERMHAIYGIVFMKTVLSSWQFYVFLPFLLICRLCRRNDPATISVWERKAFQYFA